MSRFPNSNFGTGSHNDVLYGLRFEEVLRGLVKMKKRFMPVFFLLAVFPLGAQNNGGADIYEMLFAVIALTENDLLQIMLANEEIDVNYQSPKYNDSTALQIASEFGNIVAIEKLIEQGADIELKNKNLYNALQIAVYSGNYAAAEILLKQGADIEAKDAWNRTPLFDATISGKYEAIEFYIRHGANMYTCQYDAFNALHVYISDCLRNERVLNTEIIKIYINNGYDANWEDASNYTLIHSLSMQDDVTLFELLPKDGSYDYNKPTIDRVTPLLIAVITHSYNTAAYLLENGADINYQDKQGNSPLFWAVAINDRELVEILLKFSPDLLLKNNDGEAIYDIASDEIKALL
jgi:ankyrin repeat protein